MLSLTPDILILLAATGLVAGTIDAMAGGGGLLCLPVLLSVGLPPHFVLGTNLVQSSSGTMIAVWRFAKNGLIEWNKIWPAAVAAMIGAALGAISVQQIDPDFLKPLMPFLLVAAALYFLLSKRLSDQDTHARMTMPAYAFTFAAVIGFYAGFLGPGTGSFFVASLIAFKGMSVVRATGNTKLLNLAANLAALAMFIIGGFVVWPVALVMVPFQIIGGALGARLAMRHGVRLIRPVLVIVCLVLCSKLLVQAYY